VRGHAPFVTPWRTIQIADKATELSPSVIGLNLTRQRHPQHRLDQTDEVRGDLVGHAHQHDDVELRPQARRDDHEYQALHRFRGGERIRRRPGGGLERRLGRRLDPEPHAFSFTQPYPDYDLVELARYAHSKGVKLIVHNETSGGIENYERQMDSAFALYQSLGPRRRSSRVT